jgi:hypothetical protein
MSGTARAAAPGSTISLAGAGQLDLAGRALAPLGPPVVLFSASHSGSRLLAQMVRRLGVFMGSDLNESEDSLPIFDLVRYLVETHAPDFSHLLEQGDPELTGRIRAAFAAHLAVRPVGRWGWKLPETGHVLPVVTRIFPQSHYIHLVRDGRDVAFSPFVAPKAAFWRKIYFNSDRITSWHGLAMTQRAYRAQGHRFNAARWVNSVTLGRAHGAQLCDRYLELTYEAVVADPQGAFERLADFLSVQPPHGAAFEARDVRTGSVGKWRRAPRRAIADVRAILEPTLSTFGYDWDASAGQFETRGEMFRNWLAPRLSPGGGVSAELGAEPGGLGGLFRVRTRR